MTFKDTQIIEILLNDHVYHFTLLACSNNVSTLYIRLCSHIHEYE